MPSKIEQPWSKPMSLYARFHIWRLVQMEILKIKVRNRLCQWTGHVKGDLSGPGWYGCGRCDHPIGPDGKLLPRRDNDPDVPF